MEYILGNYSLWHAVHPQTRRPLCGFTIKDKGQPPHTSTTPHRICKSCVKLEKFLLDINGFSAFNGMIRLGLNPHADFYSLEKEQVELFLNFQAAPENGMAFKMALFVIAYDGNMGIYAAEPLDIETHAFIMDRRMVGSRYKGLPFMCDGIEARAFVRAMNGVGITSFDEIADQFLREKE